MPVRSQSFPSQHKSISYGGGSNSETGALQLGMDYNRWEKIIKRRLEDTEDKFL